MRFVRSHNIILLLFSMAVLGCTSPKADIGSLGKLVTAPVLKAGGVLNTNFGSDPGQQRYLYFQGICDININGMKVGFQAGSNMPTMMVPLMTSYYVNPADVTTTDFTNDTDCSDGSFEFILSLAEVDNVLGAVDKDDVTTVYIYGLTILGETAPLILKTHDDPNTPTAATMIQLAKRWPSGFAGENRCDTIDISLTDDDGSMGVRDVDTTFIIKDSNGATLNFYETATDCAANSPVSSSVLEAHNTWKQIYFKFVSASAYPSQEIKLKAVNSVQTGAALMTSGSLHTIKVRDSATQRPQPIQVDKNIDSFIKVSSSQTHSCGLTQGGHVKCWGYNGFGQLGDGTYAQRHQPVYITALLSTAIDVVAGSSFSCAVLINNTVKCWGDNFYGQLGDGTNTMTNIPVLTSGISNAVQISAGLNHACATLSDGHLKCWGNNGFGQLGDGTYVHRNTPVITSSLTDVFQVAAGGNHTCALSSVAGTNYASCWGLNNSGQLGDGTTMMQSIPSSVANAGAVFNSITAGLSHTCAVVSDNTAQCWGDNTNYQLGTNSVAGSVLNPATVVTQPGSVTPLVNISNVFAGTSNTCALHVNNLLTCWGRNDRAQLGQAPANVNDQVSMSINNVVSVGIGSFHMCVVSNNNLYCWGDNHDGTMLLGLLGEGIYTWVGFQSPHQIADGICYPAKLYSYNYDKTINYSNVVSLELSATKLGVSYNNLGYFYDSACISQITGRLELKNGTQNIYIKHSGGTPGWLDLKMHGTPTSDYIDPFLQELYIDTSNTTVSKISLGTSSASVSVCTPVDVSTTNQNGTPIPLAGAETFSISMTNGTLYSDPYCNVGNVINSVTIPASGYRTTIYYKASSLGTQYLTVTGAYSGSSSVVIR